MTEVKNVNEILVSLYIFSFDSPQVSFCRAVTCLWLLMD